MIKLGMGRFALKIVCRGKIEKVFLFNSQKEIFTLVKRGLSAYNNK